MPDAGRSRPIYPMDWVCFSLLRQWWSGAGTLSRDQVCRELWRHEQNTRLRFDVTLGDVWGGVDRLDRLEYAHTYDDEVWLTDDGLRYVWRRVAEFASRNPAAMRVLNQDAGRSPYRSQSGLSFKALADPLGGEMYTKDVWA